MNTSTSFVKRHPVLTLLVLACGLGWWPWLVGMPVLIGPSVSIAALIVVASTRGTTGVTAWLRQLVRWRVGWHWYAVALGLPVAVTVVSVSLNVLLGRANANSRPTRRVAAHRRVLSRHFPAVRSRGGTGLARVCATPPPATLFGTRRDADPDIHCARVASAAVPGQTPVSRGRTSRFSSVTIWSSPGSTTVRTAACCL